MRRRYAITNRRRFVISIVVITFLLPFISTLILGKPSASALTVHEPYTYYEVVKIQPGDTLWEIASRYKDERTDIRQYIKTIQDFNQMTSDFIQAGHHIIVPVVKNQ